MKELRKIYALIALTVRESFAKKTFVVFFALSTVLHLFLLFAVDIDVVGGAMAMVNIFGKDIAGAEKIKIREMIVGAQSVIASLVFTGGIFLSIFATAGLVPSLLEKGHVELVVSKPIPRYLILLGRFVGAQTVMAFNVVYFIGGTWLILSAKTGFWYGPYLYAIPMVVVAFAIVFALMTLVGVLSRSAGVSIMIAYFVLFFSPFLIQKDRIYALLSSKVYYYLLEVLYQVLPKTFELGKMNQELVMGKPVESWQPLWTSGLAGMAMLFVAVTLFSRKDF